MLFGGVLYFLWGLSRHYERLLNICLTAVCKKVETRSICEFSAPKCRNGYWPWESPEAGRRRLYHDRGHSDSSAVVAPMNCCFRILKPKTQIARVSTFLQTAVILHSAVLLISCAQATVHLVSSLLQALCVIGITDYSLFFQVALNKLAIPVSLSKYDD